MADSGDDAGRADGLYAREQWRGKPVGIVTIAIARELIGACWEIATAP